MSHFEQSYTNREETKKLIREVIDVAGSTVVSTMGPDGDLGLIIEINQPNVTKDGNRVCEALDFSDIRKNVIAQLITSAAAKTDATVGDGTTTTVMMVCNLYKQFGNSMDFYTSRMLDQLVKEAKEVLDGHITQITPNDERFKKMLYTTSNYRSDIADKVIDIFNNYVDPNITLKRGRGYLEDSIEINEEISFDGRYPDNNFKPQTLRSTIRVLDVDCILINNYVREGSKKVMEVLKEKVISNYEEGKYAPILMLARDFDKDFCDNLLGLNDHLNKLLGVQRMLFLPYCINGGGSAGVDMVNDLGKLINIAPLSSIDNIDEIKEMNCELTIDQSSLRLTNISAETDERIGTLLGNILPTYDGMNFTEKATVIGQLLFDRISRLRGNNITVYVAGMTDAEITERYFLYEDAFKVAASGIRFGVIYGIGWGYAQAAEAIWNKYGSLTNCIGDEETMQWDIVQRFCKALVGQYEHLNKIDYQFGGDNKYMDMVTGKITDLPEFVYDNGSAGIVALEGAWSVVKGLSRISCILGRSNTSYRKNGN